MSYSCSDKILSSSNPLSLRLTSLKSYSPLKLRCPQDCVEWFTINLSGGFSMETVMLRVHRSRCFVFGGETVTNKTKMSNLGWEMPILNKCYTALQNYLDSQDCAVSV